MSPACSCQRRRFFRSGAAGSRDLAAFACGGVAVAIDPRALEELAGIVRIVAQQAAAESQGFSPTERQVFATIRAEHLRLIQALEAVQQHKRALRRALEQALHQVVADESASARVTPAAQSVEQLLQRLGA